MKSNRHNYILASIVLVDSVDARFVLVLKTATTLAVLAGQTERWHFRPPELTDSVEKAELRAA